MPVSISSPVPSPIYYDRITSEELAAPATSFTSVTISSVYKVIEIFVLTKCANLASVIMRFNADSGNNYVYQTIDAAAAAIGAATSGATSSFKVCQGDNSVWSSAKITIFNDGTSTKAVTIQMGHGTYEQCYTGYWNNTDLITAIAISAAENLVAGSQIYVRGCR